MATGGSRPRGSTGHMPRTLRGDDLVTLGLGLGLGRSARRSPGTRSTTRGEAGASAHGAALGPTTPTPRSLPTETRSAPRRRCRRGARGCSESRSDLPSETSYADRSAFAPGSPGPTLLTSTITSNIFLELHARCGAPASHGAAPGSGKGRGFAPDRRTLPATLAGSVAVASEAEWTSRPRSSREPAAASGRRARSGSPVPGTTWRSRRGACRKARRVSTRRRLRARTRSRSPAACRRPPT